MSRSSDVGDFTIPSAEGIRCSIRLASESAPGAQQRPRDEEEPCL